MEITKIRVGRTYNTGNYTSQRFELEVDVQEDEDFDLAIADTAKYLDRRARRVLAEQGIHHIIEPNGPTALNRPAAGAGEDDDVIPF